MATTFNNILASSRSEEDILSTSSTRMRQESFGHATSSSLSSSAIRLWSRLANQNVQLWLLLLLIVMMFIFSFAILMDLATIKTNLTVMKAQEHQPASASMVISGDDQNNLPNEESHGSMNFLCDEVQVTQKSAGQDLSTSSNFTWIKCGRENRDCAQEENTLMVNGLIVCRGMILGQLAIGQYSNLTKSCQVPHGWKVHALRTVDSEVLVASPNSYKWVATSDGTFVENSLPAGMIRGGEVMQIGRCLQDGTMVAGKVAPSHNCLYVGHQGTEVCCMSYDVLVALSKKDAITAFNQMKRFCPPSIGR